MHAGIPHASLETAIQPEAWAETSSALFEVSWAQQKRSIFHTLNLRDLQLINNWRAANNGIPVEQNFGVHGRLMSQCSMHATESSCLQVKHLAVNLSGSDRRRVHNEVYIASRSHFWNYECKKTKQVAKSKQVLCLIHLFYYVGLQTFWRHFNSIVSCRTGHFN